MKRLTLVMTIIAIDLIMVMPQISAGELRMKNIYHPKTIQGTYGWTGPVRCISTTPDGFDENGAPLDPSTLSTISTTSQGTITLKHDGTGVVQFTSVTTTDSPAEQASAGLFEASYDHVYKISNKGEISINAVPNTLVQTFLAGPNKGLAITIDTWDYTGYISADHKTMVIATPEPKVRKLMITIPSGYLTIGNTICHASHTLVRLSD